MNFEALYTTQLDAALGSDQVTLFTLAKRKAALNDAQTEFIERTECLIKQFVIAVVTGTQEYDFETAVTNYLRIAKGGPSLKMVDVAAAERYAEGPDDFPQRDPPLLNRLEPGWRGAPDSTPASWYLRREAGALQFGLHPAPSIPAGEIWTLLVPCVIRAADMSATTDVPFKAMGAAAGPPSLTPWHQALVHHAAYLLEDLRKDPQRKEQQRVLFDRLVARYWAQDRPKGSRMIQLMKDYRRGARASRFRRHSVDADSVT